MHTSQSMTCLQRTYGQMCHPNIAHCLWYCALVNCLPVMHFKANCKQALWCIVLSTLRSAKAFIYTGYHTLPGTILKRLCRTKIKNAKQKKKSSQLHNKNSKNLPTHTSHTVLWHWKRWLIMVCFAQCTQSSNVFCFVFNQCNNGLMNVNEICE